MTLPTDPIYLNDVANADRSRTGTLAGLGQQRTQTALEFGYTPTYDENGFVKALAMDPNNPYAKSALLLKSYQENLRKNTQSFASRGQLYAGSLGVAQSLSDQGYSQGSNTLQNAFINFIARNQGQINSANNNYTTALTNAQSAALLRAAQNDTGAGGDTGVSAGTPGAATSSEGYKYPAGGIKGAGQGLAPKGYSGPTGLINGKYVDSNGGVHAVTKKNGKNYYLNSNGGWTPF